MMENCPECGDRLCGNVTRRIEDGDQIEECDSCGHETMRIKDVEEKTLPERFL